MTPDFEEKQSGFSGIFFWFFAGAALFMFLGVHALWGSEGRLAETAREMLASGDFFHPAQNWQIQPVRSPLYFWTMIPFMQFFGIEELAVRVPGVLFSLAGLVGTFALARKLFDRSTALLASWLLFSTYGFLFWGRTVSVETAGMAVAVLAAAWFFHSEERSAWYRLPFFYLLLCLGALLKGFLAAVVPVLFLLPHLFSEKRWRKCASAGEFLALIAGFALFMVPFYLAFVIPPARGLADSGTLPLSAVELFSRENLCRIFLPGSWTPDFHNCSIDLLRLLLPWTPFFIFAAAAAVVNWQKLEKIHRRFLSGLLLLFVFYSVCPPSNWSQLLPLAPFCCIFTAAMIYREENGKGFSILTGLMRWVVIFAGSLAFASPVMLPVFQMMFKQLPPTLIVLSLPVAGLITLIVCIMDNEPGNRVEHFSGIQHSLASAVLGTAILMATGFGAIRPGMTVYRTGKPFIKSLNTLLAGIPEENIVFYETDSTAPFQFYLRLNGPVTVLGRGGMKSFLQKSPGEKIAIICYDRPAILESLTAELTSAGVPAQSLKPVRKEPGNGKKRLLFLFESPSVQKSEKAEKAPSSENNKIQQITGNIK